MTLLQRFERARSLTHSIPRPFFFCVLLTALSNCSGRTERDAQSSNATSSSNTGQGGSSATGSGHALTGGAEAGSANHGGSTSTGDSAGSGGTGAQPAAGDTNGGAVDNPDDVPDPPELNPDVGSPPTGGTCSDSCGNENDSCIFPMSEDGGVSARGVCSRDCSVTPCADGEECVVVGTLQLCVPHCPTGIAHCGHASLCVPAPNDSNVCMPVCTIDDHCAVGRCDVATGLCSQTLEPGPYVTGAPCTPGRTDECSGTCEKLSESSGFCTSPCQQGTFDTCELCLNTSGDFETWSTGACFQPCNCNRDCFHPDFICDPFTEHQIQAQTIFTFTRGACMPADQRPGVAGLEECQP